MVTEQKIGCPAADWERVFQRGGVLSDELNATQSSAGTAVKIGQFFAPLVGMEVPIRANGRTGKAVLCVAKGRSKEKRYHFEIHWDKASNGKVNDEDNVATHAGASAADGKKTKQTSRQQPKKRKTGQKKTTPSTTSGTDAKSRSTGSKPKPKGNQEDW